MEYVTFSLLNGLSYGMILFLVSAGLTLIFGMMGVLNFAHASFYMIGAYVGYVLAGTGHFWWGVVAAPLVCGALGIVMERYMLSGVHKLGHGHELLLTFGVALVIRELIRLGFGDLSVDYSMPAYMRFPILSLSGSQYPFYRVFMALAALVIFLSLYLLLARTRVGLVIRAAVYQPEMVGLLGHNVPLVHLLVFAVGTGLAGLAGAIAGAYFVTSPTMAADVGLMVFVVIVIGGLGSLGGALIGSLLVGLVTSFTAGLDWSLLTLIQALGFNVPAPDGPSILTVELSQLSGATPFMLMLLVLLARPEGLLGKGR
ncbi:MAG: branched-chain amino acid ABC transporter permease [Rhizobiaceae bacterium]|nr:branched-chain amino acid ABC transporter permease [Rhizobiaceae bacterium]